MMESFTLPCMRQVHLSRPKATAVTASNRTNIKQVTARMVTRGHECSSVGIQPAEGLRRSPRQTLPSPLSARSRSSKARVHFANPTLGKHRTKPAPDESESDRGETPKGKLFLRLNKKERAALSTRRIARYEAAPHACQLARGPFKTKKCERGKVYLGACVFPNYLVPVTTVGPTDPLRHVEKRESSDPALGIHSTLCLPARRGCPV